MANSRIRCGVAATPEDDYRLDGQGYQRVFRGASHEEGRNREGRRGNRP
ncbi:MAG: hypothetical protein PVG14_17520 [Anaerolineales bacterium]